MLENFDIIYNIIYKLINNIKKKYIYKTLINYYYCKKDIYKNNLILNIYIILIINLNYGNYVSIRRQYRSG